MLLLHGIASSSVTFHHVIPLLERTHRCITPAGAAELTGLATRRTQLEGEQHKLLQAHYAGAIPLDMLKKEQDRITASLEPSSTGSTLTTATTLMRVRTSTTR